MVFFCLKAQRQDTHLSKGITKPFFSLEAVTHMHSFEDGELQQGGREAVSECQHEGSLLAEQLLHGILQTEVHVPITLHKVWQAACRVQELLHLRKCQSDTFNMGTMF